MSTETQSLPAVNSQVLKAFSRALGRESHVLTQHPDLLWQQLYNRLQWEADIMAVWVSIPNKNLWTVDG